MMKIFARPLGAGALFALLLMTGCQALNRDPGDPRPPRRLSEDWQAVRADLPVGERQKLKHGKLWPPFARPTEPEQPFIHRYHAAKYWPHPYMCWDRQSVRDHVQIHIDNGWAQETTLYHYHFDEESGLLNDAGHAHMRWILENAPPQYRTCFVQHAVNAEQSEQRLNTVRLAAMDMTGGVNSPEVQLRVSTPVSTPARQIQLQNAAWVLSLPNPRINYVALPQGS